MLLPSRVALSKTATDKFRAIKGHTGLTPNILSRIAISLSLKDGSSLRNASVADTQGQVLSREVLFGDHVAIYEVLINQYALENDADASSPQTIAALIEAGVHKMGHIKSITDLINLKR